MELKAVMDMCKELNRAQQSVGAPNERALPGSSNAAYGVAHGRADIASRIFTLPREQEVAQLPQPRARGDLVGIVQLATDQICSAMGVPSSLVYDTRYSAAAGSDQMSLLSATVQQLSTYIVSGHMPASRIPLHAPRPPTASHTSCFRCTGECPHVRIQ